MPPVEEFAIDYQFGPVSFGGCDEPFVFGCSNLWRHHDNPLETMQQLYGDCLLEDFGGSFGWSVRYRQQEDYAALGISTLGEYIDAFRLRAVKLPYLRHLSVNRAMPALRRYIRHPDIFRPNWVDHPWLDRFSGPEFFVGQAGTGFGNFHQDHASVHIGFVQLEGSKEFTLFRPEDGKHLYRMMGAQFPWQMRNSAVRLDNMEDYERFPELRHVKPRKITVCAGQALFLPADWWHTTRNLTDSVSYSIRIINGSNIGKAVRRHLEGLPRLLNPPNQA